MCLPLPLLSTLSQASITIPSSVFPLVIALSECFSFPPPCCHHLYRRRSCYSPKGQVYSLIITLQTDSADSFSFCSFLSLPFSLHLTQKSQFPTERRQRDIISNEQGSASLSLHTSILTSIHPPQDRVSRRTWKVWISGERKLWMRSHRTN